MGKRYMMTRKGGLWSDEPAKSGMAPINQNVRVRSLLLQSPEDCSECRHGAVGFRPGNLPRVADHCVSRHERDCGPIDTRSTLESRRRSYITTSDM